VKRITEAPQLLISDAWKYGERGSRKSGSCRVDLPRGFESRWKALGAIKGLIAVLGACVRASTRSTTLLGP
jgi:hypothetical protein